MNKKNKNLKEFTPLSSEQSQYVYNISENSENSEKRFEADTENPCVQTPRNTPFSSDCICLDAKGEVHIVPCP